MTTTLFSGKFAVDGRPYTSVSSIIKTDTKIVQGKKSRAASGKAANLSKHLSATARGTAVHKPVRKFIRIGECDLELCYFDYFSGIQDWLSCLDLEPYWAEGPMLEKYQHLQQGPSAAVWCDKYRYIGVPDFVGKLGGVPVVMEFKTSDYLYRDDYDFRQFKQYSDWVRHYNAGMEVAAYANVWNQTTADDIHKGVVINSTPEACQLFIIERDIMKKKLTAFHKLCKEYSTDALTPLALGFSTAAGLGATGTLIDVAQRDEQGLLDNAFADTLGDAVGYGAISAGASAAATPLFGGRGPGLRGRAINNALLGAGVTAAGAGLIGLANSFGRRSGEETGDTQLGGGISVGALLAGAGYAHYATQDSFSTPATTADAEIIQEIQAMEQGTNRRPRTKR